MRNIYVHLCRGDVEVYYSSYLRTGAMMVVCARSPPRVVWSASLCWRSAVIPARFRAGAVAEHRPPGDVAPEPSWLEKLRGQQIKISISFLILIFFGWVLDFSVQNLVCDRPSTRATWE